MLRHAMPAIPLGQPIEGPEQNSSLFSYQPNGLEPPAEMAMLDTSCGVDTGTVPFHRLQKFTLSVCMMRTCLPEEASHRSRLSTIAGRPVGVSARCFQAGGNSSSSNNNFEVMMDGETGLDINYQTYQSVGPESRRQHRYKVGCPWKVSTATDSSNYGRLPGVFPRV